MPAAAAAAQASAQPASLQVFLWPLVVRLAHQLDLRRVRTWRTWRTWREGVEAVLRQRDRPHGRCLTELGTQLLGAAQAPAGVKRLQRLLKALGWSADLVAAWRLEQADALVARQPVGEALVVFDQSVQEHPESLQAEGLCRVRSSKARRLARSRPGCGGGLVGRRPITVPAILWLAATLMGWTGPGRRSWPAAGGGAQPPPPLAPLRGGLRPRPRVRSKSCVSWCRAGGAGSSHLRSWLCARTVPGSGARPPRPLCRALARSLPVGPLGVTWIARPLRHQRLAADAGQTRRGRRTGLRSGMCTGAPGSRSAPGCARPPARRAQPGAARELWLVVSRARKGAEPWRRLTHEPIRPVEEARRILRASTRR
jgi:hypothetical protein